MTLNFDRWVGKVAVVTGASSGIGAAVAERLVKEGLKVAGLARRKERVDELAKKLSGEKGKLYAIKTDITKEEEILGAFEWIKTNLGPIHILINNAGMNNLNYGLIDGKTEVFKQVLDLNVLALCICTREAVQDMKANKVDGHIVHINSVVGHNVLDYSPFKMNVYPASKYAVTALTETLRQELMHEKSKIKVTSVSPGGVLTEIVSPDKLEPTLIEKFKTFNVDFGSFPMLKSEDVAEAVYYTLATPPHVQIHELTIKPVGEAK